MSQNKTIAVDEKSPQKSFASEPTAVIKSNHYFEQTMNNGDKAQYFAQ